MGEIEKPLIQRFARERLQDGNLSESWPLEHWRDTPAYVLLGDPGAGKTTAMEVEAKKEGTCPVSASDFGVIAFTKTDEKAVHFIDALDERRAEANSESEALNSIRRQLLDLGKPKFRISCREIDWRQGVDGAALASVAPNGKVIELHLMPLTDKNIQQLLVRKYPEVTDPKSFWQQVTQLGLQDWVRNPMTLELLVKAMLLGGSGALPKSRAQIFELACEKLATEHNAIHSAVGRWRPNNVEQSLQDAGKLFAVMLLSGKSEIATNDALARGNQLTINALPLALSQHYPDNGRKLLSTKLFAAHNNGHGPVHRVVAEFLSAKAIGTLITKEGLPANRVLALMSGQDGGIVEPLRGLHAWLAVTCPRERPQLIDRDPLGVVMYGDVRGFGTCDKRQVFEALGREAERYAWFRNSLWNDHPFGALGTKDMVPMMQEILDKTDKAPSHLALVDCVVDAIRYGDDLPDMLPHLEKVMREVAYGSGLRGTALRTWIDKSSGNVGGAKSWLLEIQLGTIEDSDDELCGLLLELLYPTHVLPSEVLNYLSKPKKEKYIGRFSSFWNYYLVEQTPSGEIGNLADKLSQLQFDRKRMYSDYKLAPLFGQIVGAALKEFGSQSSIERIGNWFRACRGEYDNLAVKGDDGSEIAQWLSQNPGILKSVYVYLLNQVQADPKTGHFHFWSPIEFLFDAKRPSDWFLWLLSIAQNARTDELACFCLQTAAGAALNQPVDFEIRMEDVESWVSKNETLWPKAQEWLQAAWSSDLSGWQGDQHRQKRESETKHHAELERRKRQWTELIENHINMPWPAFAIHQIALAYKRRFSNVRGETPSERVQNLMGDGVTGVALAIGQLHGSLNRPDLPTVAQILKNGLSGKEHFVRPACLIAAELAFQDDPRVLEHWREALLRQLCAFWLTDGTEGQPGWYAAMIRRKPGVAAEVMVAYAAPMIRKRPDQSVTGLWALTRSDDLTGFAQAVVPTLLERFPIRATEPQLKHLFESLLPAALKHLDSKNLSSLISMRLTNASLDAAQRIAWLATGMFQNNKSMEKALVKFLGKSQSRIQHLLRALVSNVSRGSNHLKLKISTQAKLIECLAPHVKPGLDDETFLVGNVDEGRACIQSFIHNLAALADAAAGHALLHLRSLPALQHWYLSFDAAIAENTRVIRAAQFGHSNPKEVALTLANLAPANPADLQALLIDHLKGLQGDISGSNSNLAQQFWTDGRFGEHTPLIENQCRDRLLELLKNRLTPLDVDIDKELYANADKRMDLRAFAMLNGNRRKLPIEIKKDDHPALWTAWRDQLDLQYLNDPDTDGYGIYLALWFGLRPKALNGIKPKTAEQLKTMLCNQIPRMDRIRIAVVVLDVSLPKKK